MLAFKWWTETRPLCFALAVSANSRDPHPTLRTAFWRTSVRPLLGVLVLLATLLSGTALAVPEDACIKDEKCKEHYTKGVKLYKEELFDEALAEFQAAYAARQMPLLLVNIGRTMQKLGRPKDALSHYERFLRAEPKIDPETKKRVEDYITQVKALIESEPAQPDKPATAPLTPVSAAPAPPAPPPPGRNLMIAGGAVALVGVAGLLTGVGLFVASNSAYQSFSSTNDEFDKLTFRSRAQSLGNGSVVSYILGTVALGTGGALIGVGLREFLNHKKAQANKSASDKPASDKPQASVTLVPLSGGGALLVQGGF
ncbi:MAG: tetratricopeptide repeat protein [Myxococcales bacterium]|nr:tetratricopeptide repeat protein [Myxococcales bacterium]